MFAPGLFIGGMLGGALWRLLHNRVPGLPAQPEPFVVVGMGAMFGGVAKAPIAIMLMVAEMTGEFTMIVPAMIAISISYLTTGNTSIYENQVATRADSPAHRGEYTIPLIQAVTVEQAMHASPVTVHPATRIEDAEALMRTHDLSGVPVTDNDRLVGVFLLVDAPSARIDGRAYVADAMHTDVVVAYPTDTLHTALQRMTRSAILGLPVVDRQTPDRLIGMLTIRDLSRVLDLQVNELATNPETVRSATDDPLRRVNVGEAMSGQFERAHPAERVSEVAERLAESGQYAVVVESPEHGLCGIATIPDFERATSAGDGDRPIAEIMTRRVVTARPGQSVADAIAQPGAEIARQLPVVRDEGGRSISVGLLTRADVVVAYMRGRQRLTGGRDGRAARPRMVSDGVYSVEFVVEQGDEVNSRTLAELRLPHEAVVTAVARDGATLVPRGRLRLLTGDRVRVMGNQDALDDVRHLFE